MEKNLKTSVCGSGGERESFPGGSDDKESACNAGDPSLIPGLGSSAGERICYLLQYSWVPLVAQLVKKKL